MSMPEGDSSMFSVTETRVMLRFTPDRGGISYKE